MDSSSSSSSLSPEIPDSQDSQDIPSIPQREYTRTSRDDRLAISTALRFGIPSTQIQQVLGVTPRQIQYAKDHRLTLQHRRAGRPIGLRTPQRAALETWLV